MDDEDTKLVASELMTVLNGALDPENPYRGLYSTLGVAYGEFQEMTAIKDEWKERGLPFTWQNAAKGEWSKIPEEFQNILQGNAARVGFSKSGSSSTQEFVGKSVRPEETTKIIIKFLSKLDRRTGRTKNEQ